MGAPIPGPFRVVDLYVGAGPYYIFTRTVGFFANNTGKTTAAWGGKLRVSARVYDGIDIGVDTTYDHIFKWNVQGYLSFSFPFGPANMRKQGSRWKKQYTDKQCNDSANYMALTTQPVQRNEIVPILEKSFFGSLDFNCIFVNNAATSAGNGTFESPFQNIFDAERFSSPFDCIYVFQGNSVYDMTQTPFDREGYNLQLGQTITGSGIPFTIGGITIPAMSTGNPFLFIDEFIQSDEGSIFTLANQTTVRGFTFGFSPEPVIVNGPSFGPGDNVTNFIVELNTFTSSTALRGNGGSGGDGGTMIFRNNTILPTANMFRFNSITGGDVLILNNSFAGGFASGNILNVVGGTIMVDGNTFSPTGANNILQILSTGSNSGNTTINITNNTVNGTGTGNIISIWRTVPGNTGNTVINVTDNTLINVAISTAVAIPTNPPVGTPGLNIQSYSNTNSVTVSNNSISGPGGALIIFNVGPLGAGAVSTTIANVTGNSILGGTTTYPVTDAGDRMCILIDQNTSDGTTTLSNAEPANSYLVKVIVSPTLEDALGAMNPPGGYVAPGIDFIQVGLNDGCVFP